MSHAPPDEKLPSAPKNHGVERSGSSAVLVHHCNFRRSKSDFFKFKFKFKCLPLSERR